MSQLAVASTVSLVSKLLDAYKNNALADAVLQLNQHEKEWLTTLLRPVKAAGGQQLVGDGAAAALLLQVAVKQLQPPQGEPDSAESWLSSIHWRPALALLAHYNFGSIPDFPDHYYRRPDETALDTLCGLWDIGASTCYRYLERARQQLSESLCAQIENPNETEALKQLVSATVYEKFGRTITLDEQHTIQHWHADQAAYFERHKQPIAALWHWRQAQAWPQAIQHMQMNAGSLLAAKNLEHELAAWQTAAVDSSHKVQLFLALAKIERARGNEKEELANYQQAVGAALKPQDSGSLGVIYSQLGKYYEGRDSDRARAYYQDSLGFFGEIDSADPPISYTRTLIRLAWLYINANDPRAKNLLDQAAAHHPPLTSRLRAELEQTWAEYFHRVGDFPTAISHRLLALNSYQALADEQGSANCYVNLIVLYTETKQYEQAAHYYDQVKAIAKRHVLDPPSLVSADINVGAMHFWKGDYRAAVRAYEDGLQTALKANLVQDVGRAHYNLAEVYYTRYLLTENAADEQRGDDHISQAIAYFDQGKFAVSRSFAQQLKASLFNQQKEAIEQRLLPQEQAVHFAEMRQIEQLRKTLHPQQAVNEQIDVHLKIARIYQEISQQERAFALKLSEQNGVTTVFQKRLLGNMNEDEANNDVRDWRRKTRIEPRFLEQSYTYLSEFGRISKREYAELCQVGPTTASSHLAQLTQAGLIMRRGKGRSTHYVLPGSS